ncbi:hypothetical protein BXY51_008236 [Actinoplanes cyaneus]|nr:hypothetical protein [Actinoplanes cyaneus]
MKNLAVHASRYVLGDLLLRRVLGAVTALWRLARRR